MINQQKQQITKAVSLLKQGQLIIFPTETVYGLGADANNEQAILKVFSYKNRNSSNPLLIHIPNLEQLEHWADVQNLSSDFFKLATFFWPGALTIVIKKAKIVSSLLTAGKDSIGLRIPGHPVALQLLKEFNSGIVGTSANKSGQNNLCSFQQASQEFRDSLFILDGGICSLGVASTIISLIDQPKILRLGSISLEQIQDCLKKHIG